MGRYRKLTTVATLLVMVLGLTIVASAQWRNRRGNDDHYGRNQAYLNSAIRNLRNNSDRFTKMLDRELDRSRYDGTRREDNLNELARRFEDAAKRLDKEYDGYRDMRRSSDEARRVVSYGSQLDRALTRSRLVRDSYQLQSFWSNIEADLNTIARAYNLGYNGRYGRNNGRWGRNDDRYGRDDDRYGRRDRRRTNNRDGRYGRNGNLRATIVNLRNKSRRFENRLDRIEDDDDDDDYRYGRRRSIGNLEDLANRFDRAVKDLEDEYDNRRDYDDSYDEVRRVLSIGEQISREMSRNRVDRNLRREWDSIERDLQTLARAYNLRYDNRGYNRGSRYGIEDILRNLPF